MIAGIIFACAGQREISQFEIDWLVSDAKRLVVLEDVDSAAIVINEAARQAPRDTSVLRQQGIINRQLGTVEGRRKSAHALQELVELDRKNPDYRVELARTLIAQTFDLEAKYHLSLAIDLDSTLEEAYLMLGNLYRRPYFEDGYQQDADSAKDILTRLVRNVPESVSGNVMLAELLAIEGDVDSAASLAQRAVTIDSNSVRASLAAGYTSYRQQLFARAGRHFERAFARMDTFALTPYKFIRNLLRPQDQGTYDKFTPAQRDSFATIFWNASDFDPTTEVNERKIEHWARVWKSNLLFSNQRYEHEGWLTDMGKTMIRLGDPDERERGHVYSGNTSGTPAWYWRYQTTVLPCTLVFVDQMLSGTYNFPFPASDHTGSLRLDASKEVAYLNYRVQPEESQVIRSRSEIRFAARAYLFLDSVGNPEVQIAVQYNRGEGDSLTPPVDRLSFRASLQDAGYNILSRFESRAPDRMLPLSGGEPEIGKLPYLACVSLPAQTGPLNWNVVLESTDRSAFGRVSDTMTATDTGRDQIMMSDLIVAREVSEYSPDSQPGFKRQDQVVVPQLSDTVSLASPLVLYFEIYNLPIDIRSVTRYELTYELSLIEGSATGLKALLENLWPGRRESVSYTYREGGRERNRQRRLSLDVSDLRPGRYELVVNVNDLIMGHSARKSIEMVLLP